MNPTFAWLLALGVAGQAAQAAQNADTPAVYRCANGYSQTPCPGGKPVTAADARTPEQQAQARAVAQRDAAAAKQLANERQQREAAAKPQAATGIKPAVAAASAAQANKPKQSTKRKAKKPLSDPHLSAPMAVPPTAKPVKPAKPSKG